MKTYSQTLDNGLKVVVSSFPQLETAAVSFGVRYGSIDEKPRINGSAHFLEHMLFKGTQKRTWKEINDQTKELGVRYNAFTDHEVTVYFMQVYKGYFEKTIDILSDMVKNSTLPKKEFELERGPIINENLIRHDNPRYMISDYIPRALYRRHPARMSVGGDNDTTIKNVQREDLLDIYNNYYTPKNSILTIYGGISPTNAFSFAKKYFGDLDGDYRKPKRYEAREKQQKKTITIERKGIKQTRLGIGFMCNEFRKTELDEFLSMLVIERYLDDKMYEEIREKRGLSYDPMATYEPYSTFGFLASAAGIPPSKLEETNKVMLGEFEKLQNGEFVSADLNRTKKALHAEGKIRRESSAEMSMTMATYELMYSGSKLLEQVPELVTKVTIDDVRKYSAKYIDVDKYGMVLLKPE